MNEDNVLRFLQVCVDLFTGFDDRWEEERSLFVLSRVLYGPVPPRRTEDNFSESNYRGHAKTASRFQVNVI